MRLRFISAIALLAMMMTMMVSSVAANHGPNHGNGEADCPAGSTFLINIDAQDILALQQSDLPFELGTTDVFVIAFTLDESNELDTITILNTSGSAIRVALKAGSDQVGEASAVIAIGAPATTLSMTSGKAISNFSICSVSTTPLTPTLTLDKVVTGGAAADQNLEFTFTLNGAAITGDTLSASDAARVIATTSSSTGFTIVETVPSGWLAPSISCVDTGTMLAVATTAVLNGVTVAVGADQDVLCTFTNNRAAAAVLSPSLTLDKNVTAGNAALAFGFTLNGTAIAGLSSGDAPRVISTTAGAHTIVEVPQSGWTLASVACRDNATSAQVSTTAVTGGVTVTVGPDQDVTCVFTNTPQGGAVLPGNPATTPPSQAAAPVRQGTLAGSLPNTAMNGGPVDQVPVMLLALFALGSLGYVAQRNIAAMNSRR